MSSLASLSVWQMVLWQSSGLNSCGKTSAIDTNQLDKEQVSSPAYLLSLARDNTQLQLETERVENLNV